MRWFAVVVVAVAACSEWRDRRPDLESHLVADGDPGREESDPLADVGLPPGDLAPDEPGPTAAVVGAGWYSGMCAGECKGVLEINGVSLTSTAYDSVGSNATILSVGDGTLTESGQAELAALVAGLPPGRTYGCPGCADAAVCSIDVLSETGVLSQHRYECHEPPAAVGAAHELLYPMMRNLADCQPLDTFIVVQPCPRP
jgi:hypothetical protein